MIEARKVTKDGSADTFSIPIELIGDQISPEVLAGIGLRPLQRIAETYSESVIYPKIKDVKSSEAAVLEAIMRFAGEVENETGFLEAIAKVRLFLDDDSRVDFLVKEGLAFEDGESNAEFIVRALLDHPKLFALAGQNLIASETSNVSDRSYLLFISRRPPALTVQRIKAITPEQFQAGLQPHFQEKGYGKFCRVLKSSSDTRVGFAIDRAGRLSGREVLDSKDARKTRFERWLRSDYLFFDEQKNTLWIHAKAPSDAGIYADLIGELIGDAVNFSRNDELDFDFVLNGDLPQRLQKAQDEMMVDVTLRQLEIWSPTTTYIHRAKKNDRCLTDSRVNELDGVKPGNKVKNCSRVGLSPKNDECGKLVITGNRIALKAGLTETHAGKVLLFLGLQERHGYA